MAEIKRWLRLWSMEKRAPGKAGAFFTLPAQEA
jgi:hypothetical protein